MASVTYDHVFKRFGEVIAVNDLSIQVADKEFLVFVGPSGCGKITSLCLLAGLEEISEGRILIGDRVVNDVPPKDRDIAMVFQSYALYPNMNVAQNIAFGLEMRGVPKAERDAAVQRVAQMLQIGHLLERKPGALSGGQRQRVAMGRALARDPTLFLFDEPLSNLDAKLRVEMRAEIKLLHQRTRTTTVYVTHDQVEAMTLGDRIAVMRDGIVQQLGSPDDIYGRPATLYVAQFIGSPAMNTVPADRHGAGLTAHGLTLPLGAAEQQALAASSAQGVIYGLRPEAIRFAEQGLPGTLRMLEPTGPETYAYVDTPLGSVVVRVPGRVPHAEGDAVHLDWAPHDVHLFDAGTERRIDAV